MAFLLPNLLTGKGKKVSINATLNAVSSFFENNVVKIKNTCKATASSSNFVNITAQGTADNAAAVQSCLATAGKFGFDPSKCSSFMATQKVSNIKQKMNVNMTTDCKLSTQDVKDVQTQMTSDLQQNNTSTTDGKTNALGDFVNILGGESTTNKNYTTDVQNFVQKNFTTDVCNQIITNLTSSNVLNISAIGLAFQEVDGVDMSIESAAMVSVLMADSATAKALDEFKAKVSQTNTEKVKGLAVMVDSISSVVKSIFSTWVGIMALIGIVTLGGLYFASKVFFSSDDDDVLEKVTAVTAAKSAKL
jgi:hypothetical protein